MNPTRLLMIGVLALALGFFVSVFVYKNLQGKSSGPSEPMIEVIVAADDLQVGTRVEEHDIKIVKVPLSVVPAGAPRKRSDVIGHGVITPMTKGEFILSTKLAGENAGAGLPSLIPPGMRAVSVHVTDVISVAGFVTPGTRVDVLLTGTPTGGAEQETTTVLQNIGVLASGHTLERTATGEAQNTPVITLAVTPEDAQRLALAQQQGHIQLALRNPLDTKSEDVPSSSAHGLYKGVAAAAPPHPVAHRVSMPPKTPPPQTSPTRISVEVYQGDKKQDVNCTEDGCGSK
jgi:pilus assembly protein CpaB